VHEILDIEGVMGIKLATLDSVMTFQTVAAVVRKQPRALLITGEDRFLGYSLMMGAQAALIGMAAACTDVMAGLAESWVAQDHSQFHRLNEAVDRFAQEIFTAPMEGYVQRMLWALEADGVIPPGARDPFAPKLPASERERVHRAVRTLRGR
jgi:4-hydroxy-tetrahydrodipicolinate synthase